MQGYIATIGMFDGVHLGHQFVLQQVVRQARARACGLQSLCITFDHSPRREQVLTPLDEKLRLIRQTGIDRCEVLPFTQELKSLTARQFMDRVLRQQLGVRVLLTGYDNRFGHNREEGFEDYVRYGQELGIDVRALPPAPSSEGDIVSSSLIRQLLSNGDVEEAERCMGHHYRLTGHVTHGEHVGTGLGFPTANIVPDESRQLIPANGVYAVTSGTLKGIMNIGTRPTFGAHRQTLEVHFLHYHDDLYGRQVSVDFIRRLREERHFDSPQQLIEQLKIDAQLTEELL